MPTKHKARLKAFGYRGQPSPPPFNFNFMATGELKRAQKTGRIRSLDRLGDDSGDGANNATFLAHVLEFPEEFNVKAFWAQTLGTGDHLQEFPNAFRGALGGLGHADSSDSPVAYQSGAGLILANAAFTMRLFLLEPDNDVVKPLFQSRWWRYQFQIRDGNAEIMRLSQSWTQAQEDALNLLLENSDLTEAEQQAIDDARALIYEDYQSLSIGRGESNAYGTAYTITFLPEPRGILNIVLEGEKGEQVPNTAILRPRQNGLMWPDCALELRSNQGAFLWQVGYPLFAPIGEYTIPLKDRVNHYFVDSLGDFSAAGNWDETLPGTNVDVFLDPINSVSANLVLKLTTSNPRYTPFAYSVQGNIAAGARIWDGTTAWDSDDYLESDGTTQIKDVDLQIDSEMRRMVATVTVKDTNGAIFGDIAGDTYSNYYYPALENRIASLAIDGVPLITNGLVKAATLTNLRKATPNTTRAAVTKGETEIVLTICDQWGVLDEDVMDDDPIGDGKTLGAFLREILNNGGVNNEEMTGLSAADGITLPRAAYGEPPAVRPAIGTSRGDYLRSLIEKFGMGWILTVSTLGIWTFGPKSTGIVANFDTASDDMDEDRVLHPLDAVREFDECYTHFRVEGAEDVNGDVLCDEYTIWEAEGTGADRTGPPSKLFIGRRRKYPTLRDDGLRNQSDVTRAARSLAQLYGYNTCGRSWTYETHFDPTYLPGARATIDGLAVEITRVGGANMKENRMQLTLRERI